MNAEKIQAGPDSNSVLARMAIGESPGDGLSARNFNAMLGELSSMSVETGEYQGSEAIIIRPVNPVSKLAPIAVTLAEIDEEKRRIEADDTPLAAFALDTQLPPAEDDELFNEATLRVTHRGLVRVALGLIGEVGGSSTFNPKFDEQFYDASQDVVTLSSNLVKPIHSEAEIMEACSGTSVLKLYGAAFTHSQFAFVVSRGATIDNEVIGPTHKALGKIIYDIEQPDRGSEAKTASPQPEPELPPVTVVATPEANKPDEELPAETSAPPATDQSLEFDDATTRDPVEWLLSHFDQEGYKATIDSITANELAMQVENVLDGIKESDKKVDFALEAIKAYCHYIYDQHPDNKVIEAVTAALDKRGQSVTAIIDVTNALFKNATDEKNKPVTPLEPKLTKIPEAFQRLRHAVQRAIGIDVEKESVAKLGDITETILVKAFLEGIILKYGQVVLREAIVVLCIKIWKR